MGLLAALLVLGAPGAAQTLPEGPRHFLYLSDQRIITVELTGPERAILNYINLSDKIEMIQAPMLVVVDEGGAGFRGHVLEDESPGAGAQRYGVGELVREREYKGFTIRGDFRLQVPAGRVLYKLGGRILELEPLTPDDFDRLAARVAQIEIQAASSKEALFRAGFHQGHGNLHFAGTPEAGDLEELFPTLELLSPVLLASPAPRLPASAHDLPDPVVVQVSAAVSRAGGLYNLSVVNGVCPDLDEMAMATVRNSWRFLPAIAGGELREATLTLNVVFQR